jgi:hypothetical protein
MSMETHVLAQQAHFEMIKIWEKVGLISITFHLKSMRKAWKFMKARTRYVGLLTIGPGVFFQFRGNPGWNGSANFVNINIDDIATFNVNLQKTSPKATSPPAQESP